MPIDHICFDHGTHLFFLICTFFFMPFICTIMIWGWSKGPQTPRHGNGSSMAVSIVSAQTRRLFHPKKGPVLRRVLPMFEWEALVTNYLDVCWGSRPAPSFIIPKLASVETHPFLAVETVRKNHRGFVVDDPNMDPNFRGSIFIRYLNVLNPLILIFGSQQSTGKKWVAGQELSKTTFRLIWLVWGPRPQSISWQNICV